MALNQFEKTCIDEIHTIVTGKHSERRFGSQAKQALETIKHGTQEQRQALIRYYITEMGLEAVQAEIASCEEQAVRLAERKAELEDKQAHMTAYVE